MAHVYAPTNASVALDGLDPHAVKVLKNQILIYLALAFLQFRSTTAAHYAFLIDKFDSHVD